jgi:UDP-2-acetamido-3-amino-2,3-dideoxy-glucuronate N-acetyltransferase
LNIGRIRSEENILWSFAPHDISVILMLLGEMPETIYATGGNYLQKQVADVTISTMDFSSGVKAHIFISWLHPYKEQKLVVVGDEKMAVFDDLGPEKLKIYPHKVQWLQRNPVATRAEAEVVHVTMEEPLKEECAHFLECISKGLKPKTDGEEGLRVLRILQLFQKSLDNNGCKIRLDEVQKPLRQLPPQEAKDLSYFVHPSTYVDDDVIIGRGTRVWHFSHVLTGSRIGENCNIGQNVLIGPDVIIGNSCKIQGNVSIFKGVTLEDHVFCGPSMVFTNVYNPRAHIRRMNELRPTLVKNGATLGANCTIVCGLTIGRHAFVGAGAVVTKDVPDYALMVGNPAKPKGWMCACGIQLAFNSKRYKCKVCGRRYEKVKANQITEI